MDNKNLIKIVFRLLFESKEMKLEDISLYFAKEYVQNVGSEVLDFHDFISHIGKVREKLAECRVTFHTLISEGNIVFSNHVVDAILRNGTILRQHVLAEFEMSEGKIIRCDELAHMLEGEVSESNLASVH